jgi:hypothetical protein
VGFRSTTQQSAKSLSGIGGSDLAVHVNPKALESMSGSWQQSWSGRARSAAYCRSRAPCVACDICIRHALTLDVQTNACPDACAVFHSP